ncbi:MAG: zinc ribbon domain-containing protein [Treponema sp.]|nr:zinc ribbon domain-containing protein [Treponema sp.]
MPTYGYECKSCKHTFDAFQSMKDDPLTECPKCHKELRRLINGGGGLIFRGGGFYVNDKSGGSSKAEASKSEGPKAEACGSCAQAEACPAAVTA